MVQTADHTTNTTMAVVTTATAINTTTLPTYSTYTTLTGMNQQHWTILQTTNMNTDNTSTATAQRLITTPIPIPAMMDIPAMFKMLSDISAQVAGGNSITNGIRADLNNYMKKADETSQEVDEQKQLLSDTVLNFNKCVDSVQILSGIAMRQGREIEQLKTKLENLEVRENKTKIVIQGVEETDEENTTHVALAFFKAKLLIDKTIPVTRA